MKKLYVLSALAALATGVLQGAETLPKPEIEELFQPLGGESASLSSDGKWFAVINRDEKGTGNLGLINLDSGKVEGLQAAGGMDVYSYRWMSSDRLLFNLTKNKLYVHGLFAAEVGRLQRAIPINLNDALHIVGLPKARPNHVLVWVVADATEGGRVGDLVELNTRVSVAVANPAAVVLDRSVADKSVVRRYSPPKDGEVLKWVADYDGELGLCLTYSDGKQRLHRYHIKEDKWTPLNLDLGKFDVIRMDPDGQHLWVNDYDPQEGFRLRQYHMASGKFGETVYADKKYDIGEGNFYFSAKDRSFVGLSYPQQRRKQVWFKQQLANAQAAVDQNYGEWDNRLIDFDEAEKRFLFYGTGDRQPGVYLLLDMEKKTLAPITNESQFLRAKALAETRPYQFKTRDGVELEGYLTMPANVAKLPPLVVLAHGGPHTRDEWVFNAEVQFLASKGYAVLQPNYRGSTGYRPDISGHSYEFRLMHEDVTDATKAMQASGLIDGKRVAIMGGSFGGYLALTGVAFEPDLYRCAVSVCGVFDWEKMVKDKRWKGVPGQYSLLRDRVGEPGKDREYFESISPLSQAAKIKVPIFIAHGKDDGVVEVGQSRKLAQTLKKQGTPHETFYRSLEGHGFYDYKNQVDFYRQVEAFLAKSLK